MPNNGNKEDDIWRKNAKQQPPDLINLIKKFLGSGANKKPGSDKPGPGGDIGKSYAGKFIIFGVLLILIIWALSGIFILGPTEQSVILRFGKYQETVGPGPHWIPRIIDTNYTADVQQVRHFKYQSEMLTKDENIISVELTVQYRIDDLKNFYFDVVGPEATLQQATSSALRQVVGETELDTILTTGRQQLTDEVDQQIKNILANYKTGIFITDVTLQPAKPPEAVTAAFDDAIKAREDKQRYVNQANAYERKIMSEANGTVARLQQSASAYKQEVVLRAKGDVARYLALLEPYQKAPGVTRERLYIDTISNVLSNTRNVLVEGGGNNVLYLPISQLMKQHMAQLKPGNLNLQSFNDAVSSGAANPNLSNDTASNNGGSYGQPRPSYPMGGGQ